MEGFDSFCGVNGDDVSECSAANDFVNFFVEGGVSEYEAEYDGAILLFGDCCEFLNFFDVLCCGFF